MQGQDALGQAILAVLGIPRSTRVKWTEPPEEGSKDAKSGAQGHASRQLPSLKHRNLEIHKRTEKPELSKEDYWHETAHAKWDELPGESKDQWKKIYELVIAGKIMPPTEYSRYDPEELYAESIGKKFPGKVIDPNLKRLIAKTAQSSWGVK